jgi:hypothetical protein
MNQSKELLTFFIPHSDDQWTMRERLILAHEKLDRLHHEEWCQIIDYIGLFAKLGLKVAMNEAFNIETPRFEFDKIKLELSFNDLQHPTPAVREKILGRFDQLRSIRDRHYKKLKQIQSAHNVTGLTIVEYVFGYLDKEPQVIYAPGWGDDSELPLIESDLDILNNWKDHLADVWKSGLDGYQIYRWDDEEKHDHPCKLSSIAEFDAYLATCKWVEPWVRDGFPSITIGRTTNMTGWRMVQTFTAVPNGTPVNKIHL